MKNAIPLVLSVLLGLAAVFAVSRVISSNNAKVEEKIMVVAAARDLKKGEVIAEGFFMPKEVALSAVPAQAIIWSRAPMIIGQKLIQPITSGNYIFMNDVGMSQGMGNVVGEGEWAVAIQIADKAMASILQGGDEIAIVGTFNLEKKKPAQDGTNQPGKSAKEVTMVIFPKVRILEVGSKDRNSSGATIVVLLPPQQAQTLIAAQRVAEIYPVLRRPNDTTALNRLDAGVVTLDTFSAMLDDLETVVVPKIPKDK